ncbi:MAG: hypothetical protein ACYTEQ_12185 [Planctomycetota bacterium]|jgi:hypothetical protein
MFETGGVLQTYRLELSPRHLLHRAAAAVRIFDHPLKFLTYEGGLSEDKGFVQIEDSGTYQILDEDENFRRMQMDGRILNGLFTLTRIENDRWECSFS